MLDGFVNGVVADIIGGRFGTPQEVIANLLLDEAMAIVSANDGVGQRQVLQYDVQFSSVTLGDLTAEDKGDLIGLTDGAVGIQQALAQGIEGGTAVEDEGVTILDLGKEETMLTSGLFALTLGEEGGESIEPIASTLQQIAGSERISQFLQPFGIPATQEGVGGLLKVDALLPQAQG